MNFAPNFEKIKLSPKQARLIKPFFTNLDKNTFAVSFLPPEVIGALCSRTSRAKEDLRVVLLKEFIEPFIKEKTEYGKSLKRLISFLHKNPIELIFSNPKGREFYVKWLAQYGDDSIAQMAGTHLIFSAISQIAIKHFEDMRIGLAPIEKSTRYVDYSSKINGKYRYYTDPNLKNLGLEKEYKKAMDNLFDTYTKIKDQYFTLLKEKYPLDKDQVLRAKAFDSVRGLLPMSTLSQIAFFGNGQAFEYLMARSLDHPMGEIAYLANEALVELNKIIPAFLRRSEGEQAKVYRDYLVGKDLAVEKMVNKLKIKNKRKDVTLVELVDFEKNGEEKIIAALLYPKLHMPFENVFKVVLKMSLKQKKEILDSVFAKRKARWYKVPRAFEKAYVTFDMVLNNGAWRDLHRHRMLSQYRQRFSIYNGFDIPKDLIDAGLDKLFVSAIKKAEDVFKKIEKKDKDLAQYAVTMAHRVRFLQKQNLRAFFWQSELRTTSQGHPDYRKIEQEKAKLIKKVYPLIGKYLMVDFETYDFARRGTIEKIEQREKKLLESLRK
ncbi:MAG: FAD-dependent thymidylate synthase [Candidatus Levybacteria bacterium]|nr:FAD-dependent thymidylate synthase [Candidatus Levybacteria bacterium]